LQTAKLQLQNCKIAVGKLQNCKIQTAKLQNCIIQTAKLQNCRLQFRNSEITPFRVLRSIIYKTPVPVAFSFIFPNVELIRYFAKIAELQSTAIFATAILIIRLFLYFICC